MNEKTGKLHWRYQRTELLIASKPSTASIVTFFILLFHKPAAIIKESEQDNEVNECLTYLSRPQAVLLENGVVIRKTYKRQREPRSKCRATDSKIFKIGWRFRRGLMGVSNE